MAKKSTTYVCNNCGDTSSKWQGKCPSCNEWNSFVEFRESKVKGAALGQKLETTNFSQISSAVGDVRYTSSYTSVDDVLGGGLVAGSISLLAGEPGIGKSTLLLQYAASLAEQHKVVYVSGEESPSQIRMRGERLDVLKSPLQIAGSTNVDDIITSIQSDNPDVVIVDSIQTMYTPSLEGIPGSISQITTCAHALQRAAKSTKTAIVMVGHVTKEGAIAGPKILEHLVDTVLHLEGDKYGGFKVLRSIKNRFGNTNELALFHMQQAGMIEVLNPSAALLEERQTNDGSVVYAAMEGTRAILVEIQALVHKSNFGYPKRSAVGIDQNRLNLLVAVISKRTKLDLSEYDIYVNVVGGMKISEPAADLVVCMAIASSARNLALDPQTVVFGEVSLSGDVRTVTSDELRTKEAKKLGFKTVICATRSANDSHVVTVTSLKDALNTFLKK